MDQLFWGIAVAVAVALAVLSAGHALIMKRDPRSALGWIVISLTMPVFGPFFYWSMGVNRIHRKARSWQEKGERLSGPYNFRAKETTEAASFLPPGAEYMIELRHLSDRVANSPLLAGNSVVPLNNGEEAYPAMVRAIDEARRTINLSTYIFDGDGAGHRFADALRRAADRGVEVRVTIDGLGEKYSFPRARTLLKGSKVRINRFLPLRGGFYMNLRNHRKVLIVDGSLAFTGGMNLGDRHLVERSEGPPPVQDMHFRVEGPVVAELQRAFLEDWYFVTRELLDYDRFFPKIEPAGTALARAVSDGPDQEIGRLQWIMMGALSCARRRVRIMTPYLIPDRPLVSALVTAALRGVEVTIVLPEVNNLPFVHWATRAYLWELLQHGIRIYYQPAPFAHTKLFLVDGLWSFIGSANLDPRSLRLNFELNLEIYDREFTMGLVGHFAEVMARSRQVSLDEMDDRPLLEKLRDSAAKLFSPYL